ncbi:MAG: hypothetical protein ACFFG0_17760, partial [Candidatus Thorarchaeota archaeon]
MYYNFPTEYEYNELGGFFSKIRKKFKKSFKKHIKRAIKPVDKLIRLQTRPLKSIIKHQGIVGRKIGLPLSFIRVHESVARKAIKGHEKVGQKIGKMHVNIAVGTTKFGIEEPDKIWRY